MTNRDIRDENVYRTNDPNYPFVTPVSRGTNPTPLSDTLAVFAARHAAALYRGHNGVFDGEHGVVTVSTIDVDSIIDNRTITDEDFCQLCYADGVEAGLQSVFVGDIEEIMCDRHAAQTRDDEAMTESERERDRQLGDMYAAEATGI